MGIAIGWSSRKGGISSRPPNIPGAGIADSSASEAGKKGTAACALNRRTP